MNAPSAYAIPGIPQSAITAAGIVLPTSVVGVYSIQRTCVDASRYFRISQVKSENKKMNVEHEAHAERKPAR